MLLSLNPIRLRQGLTALEQDQMPFAAALAINRTLEEGQAAFRASLPSHFTLRRKQFIERLVKIENRDRASKGNLSGKMGVQGDHARLLTKFEAGGIKKPSGRSLVVPIDVRRNKQDIVTNRNRPKAFAFDERRTNSGTGIAIYAGSRRTFMVRFPDGRGWIFQRRRRGKHGELFTGTSVLYALEPRAPLPASLHFESTTMPVLRARFPVNFRGLLDYAVQTAK